MHNISTRICNSIQEWYSARDSFRCSNIFNGLCPGRFSERRLQVHQEQQPRNSLIRSDQSSEGSVNQPDVGSRKNICQRMVSRLFKNQEAVSKPASFDSASTSASASGSASASSPVNIEQENNKSNNKAALASFRLANELLEGAHSGLKIEEAKSGIRSNQLYRMLVDALVAPSDNKENVDKKACVRHAVLDALKELIENNSSGDNAIIQFMITELNKNSNAEEVISHFKDNAQFNNSNHFEAVFAKASAGVENIVNQMNERSSLNLTAEEAEEIKNLLCIYSLGAFSVNISQGMIEFLKEVNVDKPFVKTQGAARIKSASKALNFVLNAKSLLMVQMIYLYFSLLESIKQKEFTNKFENEAQYGLFLVFCTIFTTLNGSVKNSYAIRRTEQINQHSSNFLTGSAISLNTLKDVTTLIGGTFSMLPLVDGIPYAQTLNAVSSTAFQFTFIARIANAWGEDVNKLIKKSLTGKSILKIAIPPAAVFCAIASLAHIVPNENFSDLIRYDGKSPEFYVHIPRSLVEGIFNKSETVTGEFGRIFLLSGACLSWAMNRFCKSFIDNINNPELREKLKGLENKFDIRTGITLFTQVFSVVKEFYPKVGEPNTLYQVMMTILDGMKSVFWESNVSKINAELIKDKIKDEIKQKINRDHSNHIQDSFESQGLKDVGDYFKVFAKFLENSEVNTELEALHADLEGKTAVDLVLEQANETVTRMSNKETKRAPLSEVIFSKNRLEDNDFKASNTAVNFSETEALISNRTDYTDSSSRFQVSMVNTGKVENPPVTKSDTIIPLDPQEDNNKDEVFELNRENLFSLLNKSFGKHSVGEISLDLNGPDENHSKESDPNNNLATSGNPKDVIVPMGNLENLGGGSASNSTYSHNLSEVEINRFNRLETDV